MRRLNGAVKQFTVANAKHWDAVERDEVQVLIEVQSSLPAYLNTAFMLARILNEEHGISPLLLSEGRLRSPETRVIAASFGIYAFGRLFDGLRLMLYLLQSLPELLRYLLTAFDPRTFLDYEIEGIQVGDIVHDSYVRRGRRYTGSLKFRLPFFREYLKAVLYLRAIETFFKGRNIKKIILSHRCYSFFGVLFRYGLKHGCEVMIVKRSHVRIYRDYSDVYVNEFKPDQEMIERIVGEVDQQKLAELMAHRFGGGVRQHDVISAYTGKREYSREELKKEIQLDDDLPWVFLLPHAFSDSNNINEGMVFIDYYDWFVQTVTHMGGSGRANWLVKPHPSSYMYNETGEVESVLRSHGVKNVKVLPKDFHSKSVFDLADCLVTISGTAGVEAACMGVPVITAGCSTYSHLGFVTLARDQDEYFRLLNNVRDLPALNAEQISRARAMLYWMNEAAYCDSSIVPTYQYSPGLAQGELADRKAELYEEMAAALEKQDPRKDAFYQAARTMLRGDTNCISGMT